MARFRWTLVLIIACLPILATVINAFRVHRGSYESGETGLKKQKCDDCDVSGVKNGKLNSVKIESAKRSYEELKKAVREKQQLIDRRRTEPKLSFQFHDDDDDDDDDDEDFGLLSSKSDVKSKNPVKNVKINKNNIDSKSSSKSKKSINVNMVDDDGDDDDDEDDDEDKDLQFENKKGTAAKKKGDINKANEKLKQKEKVINKNVDKETADDEDEDDDDDDKKMSNSNKLKEHIKLSFKLGEDDDDDDDSDEDDSADLQEKHQQKLSAEIETILKTDTKDSKRHSKKVQIVVDDDDDDDEDSDDDNEDEILVKTKMNKKTDSDKPKKQDSKESKEKKKSGTKDLHKIYEDSDDEVKITPKPVEKVKKPEFQKEAKSSEIKNKVTDVKKTVEQIPAKQKKEDTKESKVMEEKPKKETHKEESPKTDKETLKLKTHVEKETKPTVESKKKDDRPKNEMKDLGEKSKLKDEKKEKTSYETLVESQDILTRSESNLKHVSEALYRRNLLQSEFEDFYAFFPTFAPNFSRIHNPECRRHGQIVLRQLRGTKLWALNMLDATAKIPSGILQGNGIQLGDFDQCLGSRARVQLDTGSVVKVQGKYCLARLDVKAEHPELEVPVHLAQAKNLLKSRIDDPGHFVPRFSTLSWGVCVPAACGAEDVELALRDAVKHYQHTSGLLLRIKVDDDDCHTLDAADWWDEWLEWPTLLTMSFYAVIVLLVLVATIQDFIAGRKSDEGQGPEESDDKAECDQKETNDEEKEEGIEDKKNSDGLLSSFSLYRTVGKLAAAGTADEISCIHGVRGIAALALLVSHKFLPVAVTPYTNRLRITELASSPAWSWARAGWMYTDCFLLLSGALTAHRIACDSDTGAPRRLFSRYLRLTPALLAVVLYYAYIWDKVSTGPMWGTLVTKNAEVCQEGWYWNLLYIQNYFGFEEMCAPQTHQLALDMQLTVLGCVVVWIIQVKPILKWLLPAVHMWAAYSRYTTVHEHRLTMLAYHGVSVSQLYRTARLSYQSIFHRSTPYLIGLSLGLALQKPSKHNKFVQIVGWLTSITLWSLVWWAGIDSGSTLYKYNVVSAARYAALAPVASSLAVAWVIYAVHTGHSEFLSKFLCCRPLVLISRLSYALYLCQFVVFLTHAGTVRTSSEFTLMSLIDVQEISAIILSSTILTLTFITPMQSLHKVFIFSSKSETQEETEATETEADTRSAERETKTGPKKEMEVPQIRSRQHLIAHREVLEEIPEAELEFEIQREKNEGLEEILEEEEDEEAADESLENHLEDEDLEIIEEEGGEDDYWAERGDYEYTPRRSQQIDDEQELDEWEWTSSANGRNGAQHYRYRR